MSFDPDFSVIVSEALASTLVVGTVVAGVGTKVSNVIDDEAVDTVEVLSFVKLSKYSSADVRLIGRAMLDGDGLTTVFWGKMVSYGWGFSIKVDVLGGPTTVKKNTQLVELVNIAKAPKDNV